MGDSVISCYNPAGGTLTCRHLCSYRKAGRRYLSSWVLVAYTAVTGGTIPGPVSTHCGVCRSSSSIKASRKTAMKRVRIVTRQLPLLRLMPPHRRWDNLENCRIGSAIFADHKYRDRGNFEWHAKCPNPLWPSLGFRGYPCSNFENKAAFHRCGP